MTTPNLRGLLGCAERNARERILRKVCMYACTSMANFAGSRGRGKWVKDGCEMPGLGKEEFG